MHYMMLMYSEERPGGPSEDTAAASRAGNWKVIEEATAKGVLIGVGPLASTASATTVRMKDGKALVTDGPFAETKEQLAGFYIIDCEDLEEAIGWASKIPTTCKGGPGCIEIRPMPALPKKDAAHDGELLSASRD
jgi:hypothetical protein